MTRLQVWCAALVGTTIAVAICYFWIDRPLAEFAHAELREFPLFHRLTQVPELFRPLAAIVFLGLGLRAVSGRVLNRPQAVLVVFSISVMASDLIKRPLQLVFGRTWPETWTNNNPSLIRDNVAGFNPFHGGSGYEAFPSGHASLACAAMGVLWFCYSRFRPLYLLFVLSVVVGLIGANYHFLGDCVSGAFVGWTIGWCAVALWDMGGSRVPLAQKKA